MLFYKILRQLKTNQVSFTQYLERRNLDFISGKYYGSFAIKYSPDSYSKFLNEESVFFEFRTKSIQQLNVTNQKFLALIDNREQFGLSFEDFELSVGNSLETIEELKDSDITEQIRYIDKCYGIRISKVFFRTDDHLMITIQKNGVIGFDNELINLGKHSLLKLIDTLNIGLSVIKE